MTVKLDLTIRRGIILKLGTWKKICVKIV